MNMGQGAGVIKGQQNLTPDYVGIHHQMELNNPNMSELDNDIYQMQKGFDCTGNILGMVNYQSGKLGSEVNFDADEKESTVGGVNKGQGHQQSKGQRPPLPSRCPATAADNIQSGGGGNSTISSTKSNGQYSHINYICTLSMVTLS